MILYLLTILISSCKLTVGVEIPISKLTNSRVSRVPVEIISTVCNEHIKLPYNLPPVTCKGGYGVWYGSIMVVSHKSKELVLEQPLSVYYGSTNGIVLYLNSNAIERIREHLTSKDVNVQIAIFNDTLDNIEMYVSSIWVNGQAVGTDGGVLYIESGSRAVLKLSDVAVGSLLSSGIEGVGLYPVK
ncbi:hypothetical protein VPHK469_0013 [Vibrio phage K469]